MDSIKVYTETDFKETSIGKVPRDWDVTRIEEVCEVVGGGTPSTYVKEYWNGEIPFVTPTDITELEKRNVNFLDKTKSYITKKGLKNSSAKLLPPNSVLLTSRATIGYGLINKIPMATNQGFANLICSEKAYNLYILYLMRFLRKTLLQMASGSTFKEVARGVIRNLKIPLPSVQEQRMISDILCIVDDVLFKTDGIITKTELLKRGLMQELLTKGIGQKEFKDTEIGKIPKTWHVAKLSEVAIKIKDMDHKMPDKQEQGVPFVSIKCMLKYPDFAFDIDSNDPDLEFISKQDYESQIKRFDVEMGDIIYSRFGSIGNAKFVVTDQPFLASYSIVLIKADKTRVDPIYLTCALNSEEVRRQAKVATKGATNRNLHLEDIRNLRLPVPTMEEQERIAEAIVAADRSLGLEKEEKAKIESVRQGLTDMLLTGKVRAKVD